MTKNAEALANLIKPTVVKAQDTAEKAPAIPVASTDTDARIKALEAQLAQAQAALKAQPKAAGRLTMKVSGKGAVSVYGLGRFPVTLYADQWNRLLDMKDDLAKFIADNAASLSTKP